MKELNLTDEKNARSDVESGSVGIGGVETPPTTTVTAAAVKIEEENTADNKSSHSSVGSEDTPSRLQTASHSSEVGCSHVGQRKKRVSILLFSSTIASLIVLSSFMLALLIRFLMNGT